MKFIAYVTMFFASITTCVTLPFVTFVIAMDKWTLWAQKEIKEINKRLEV